MEDKLSGMKTSRNPEGVHAPLANYAHQIEVSSSERMLILSGQVGMKENGEIPEDPLEQLDVAFENVFRNLEAAAMAPSDLLKLTFYFVGDVDADRRRALLLTKLRDHKPCMTLLFVAALASPGIKVEIDAVASRAD